MAVPIPFQCYAIWDTADGFNFYLLFFLIDILNNYALQCTEFLFIAVCCLIESRFCYICKKLEQKQPKITINSICKTVDTFLVPNQTNYEDLIVANDIEKFRRAFRKLLKISEILNSQFNVRLLIALGVCTFNVLTNLYMGLFGGFGGKMFKALLWACYYFFRLVWICVACEFLCKKVKKY